MKKNHRGETYKKHPRREAGVIGLFGSQEARIKRSRCTAGGGRSTRRNSMNRGESAVSHWDHKCSPPYTRTKREACGKLNSAMNWERLIHVPKFKIVSFAQPSLILWWCFNQGTCLANSCFGILWPSHDRWNERVDVVMVRTAPIAMSVSGPRWDGDVESSMLASWPSTFEVSVAVKRV